MRNKICYSYLFTVKDIVRLYIARDNKDNIETIRRAIKIGALPEGWRYEFEQKIEQLERKYEKLIL
jgi:hypothetical protein